MRNEIDGEGTPSRQRPMKKPKTLTDDVLRNVNEHFTRPKVDDRFDVYAKNINMKLRDLAKEQRIIAEKLINDTLFLAEMGNLTLSHSVKGPECTNINSNQPFMPTTQYQYQHQVNSQFQSPQYQNEDSTQFTVSRPSSARSYFSNFSTDE
ncbi:hypothetical protein NQ314_008832 [Rhamnusium bicolor]|uniref:Uncharacterized protein n=1 Tax=Rhamnusium bicolor TaxID=1586634 RepID=A0AAV8Y6E6_9CUCU|nr:hypothetical protein NQ314_008832 [Rhamnusium bicolor]